MSLSPSDRLNTVHLNLYQSCTRMCVMCTGSIESNNLHMHKGLLPNKGSLRKNQEHEGSACTAKKVQRQTEKQKKSTTTHFLY